jgi:hypothetical protein
MRCKCRNLSKKEVIMYPRADFRVVFPGSFIPRVDIGGIYELRTNAVQITDASVDYGISPICYNALPCKSVVLLSVHADAPAGGESLPVTIAVPNNGQSTVSSASTTTGTTKIPVVDSKNSNVTGADVTGSTERLAYIDKRNGIIRFLEFTASAAPAPTASAEPAASKNSK